jgi:hypothetical protein
MTGNRFLAREDNPRPILAMTFADLFRLMIISIGLLRLAFWSE